MRFMRSIWDKLLIWVVSIISVASRCKNWIINWCFLKCLRVTWCSFLSALSSFHLSSISSVLLLHYFAQVFFLLDFTQVSLHSLLHLILSLWSRRWWSSFVIFLSIQLRVRCFLNLKNILRRRCIFSFLILS